MNVVIMKEKFVFWVFSCYVDVQCYWCFLSWMYISIAYIAH